MWRTSSAASVRVPKAYAETARRDNHSSPVSITPRNRDQMARSFDVLELVPPGLVPIGEWCLAGQVDRAAAGMVGHWGMAGKA